MNIIAHRGANRHFPQNTLPAFQKAVALGADGIETDVHLTADGEIVICHDYTIDGTSNGSGDINLMTLAELRQYDFGVRQGEPFAGLRIPLLRECLEIVRGLKLINIEIKPPRGGSMLVAEKTLAMVAEMGLSDKVLISSFDCNVLIAAKKIAPTVRTGMLYDFVIEESPHVEEIMDDPAAFAKKIGADAMHPFVMLMGADPEDAAEYIEDCHKAGVDVNPWTVNDSEVVQLMQSLHCDGVITDVPDIARNAIEE
ncbi:MAG: glycerophosphodiester phosphodiesterase [Oscillospiraceae bacterium]|jgi:glycerophosphoryl diester phosphodiesterase|nr:glycerophosphodiester phosphodiesterase [Oscillospiraceae bacterium]